jgi:hypothetical protein
MSKRCPWIHDHKTGTQAEEEFLRANRGTMSAKAMAAALPGRTPDAVQSRRTQLRIFKRDLRPAAPASWPKCTRERWSADDIEILRDCVGGFPEAVQALHFPHRTASAIQTKMAQLGVPRWTAVRMSSSEDLQVAA